MTITPTVLAVQEPELLKWKGSIFIPYLFDGTHTFVLELLPNGQSLVRQSETFDDILIPLARCGLFKDTLDQFEAMNKALKDYVERGE